MDVKGSRQRFIADDFNADVEVVSFVLASLFVILEYVTGYIQRIHSGILRLERLSVVPLDRLVASARQSRISSRRAARIPHTNVPDVARANLLKPKQNKPLTQGHCI
ncbi:uncharacterized protein LOC111265557 [Varroa jacobsoni]|uniref:Uncharacterized protein n=1 Tax=Varroa destructor TaxID=109461 RepID=A0A7M7KAD8_VARDE|nr:uncharacterized protein LOC111251533 [Varroa destructor]XP_022663916.1 uncharacterized protein LOC111251533 [Varroa destructor]XP_022698070.1 uncharacterized protein LOC111265557 [Varroa jacobsoni]XP_022698071.1 uncharacterized protein LOC111265557 [Varroa jacobsoni]XP_022698072.1 uncharacterized protein LOC111265557 [Varroa jacobsoni]